MKRWQDALLIVAVLCALISTVAVIGVFRGNAPVVRELTATPVDIGPDWGQLADGGQVVKEGPGPLVVVFTDFECPYCKQFAEATLARLQADETFAGHIVYRQYPLPKHRFAEQVALGAVCADTQGQFLAFHDEAFRVQDSLGLITITEVARRARVANHEAFEACVTGDSARAVVDRGRADGDRIGIRGTPAIIIDGRMHFGTMTEERIRELILALKG